MTDDASQLARARRRSAKRRAGELRELQLRLAGGQPLTQRDVELARQAVATGLERAADALERSMHAHRSAARAHDRAADTHDRAAHISTGDIAVHRDRAEQHRNAADADRAQATREDAELATLRSGSAGKAGAKVLPPDDVQPWSSGGG